MSARALLSAGLLLFVGVAVVWVIVDEKGGTDEGESVLSEPATAGGEPAVASPAGEVTKQKLVAYYFHGDVRCATCRTIEKYAQEALQDAFGEKLAEGRIEWRVVNIDEKENEHFAEDFKLVSSSVVLVDVVDGKPGKWTTLARVWELVGDEGAFKSYVQEEARTHFGSKT